MAGVGCFGAAAEAGNSRGRQPRGGKSPILAEFWDPSSEWQEEDYFFDAPSPTP
jgi:hypothetical protein